MKIFFDLDGTLIDTSKRHYSVYRQCAKEYGDEHLPYDRYWSLKRNNVSWGEILDLSGVSKTARDEFMNLFIDLIESSKYLKMDKPFRSSLNVLDILSKENKLVLVSFRRNRESLLEQLAHIDFEKYFSDILSGHAETKKDVLEKKAEIINEAVGVESEDVIVGDTEADISAGKTLGVHTVSVTTGIRSEQYLRQFSPESVISDIRELPDIVQRIKN